MKTIPPPPLATFLFYCVSIVGGRKAGHTKTTQLFVQVRVDFFHFLAMSYVSTQTRSLTVRLSGSTTAVVFFSAFWSIQCYYAKGSYNSYKSWLVIFMMIRAVIIFSSPPSKIVPLCSYFILYGCVMAQLISKLDVAEDTPSIPSQHAREYTQQQRK